MKENLLKLYHFSNSWTGTIIIVLFIIFFGIQAFVIPSGSMISTLLIGDHLFVKKFAYGIPDPHIPFVEVPIVTTKNGHIIDGDRPKGGDIVVFRYPLSEKLHFVKRCVAVAGDEVMLHNKDLYVSPKDQTSLTAIYKEYEKVTIGGKQWVKNPYTKEHAGIHNELKRIDDFGLFGEYAQELKDPNVYYENHKNDKIIFENDFVMLEGNDKQQRKYYFGPFTLGEEQFFMMGDNRDNSADSRYWGPVKYSQIVGTPWFVYFSWDSGTAEQSGDYSIRWDRVFKSVSSIEENLKLKQAK